MERPRYAVSRQRSCQECSITKAKCDRQPGGCTRCWERNIRCVYPKATIVKNERTAPANSGGTESPTSASTMLKPSNMRTVLPSRHSSSSSPVSSHSQQTASLCPPLLLPSTAKMDTNFSALKLSCPINADDITARWMNPYIPVPGQAVKSYPPAVTALISRNLESYAAISVRGRHLVPFIHPAQLSGLHVHGDSPLVVCLGLLQSWGVPGSENALSRVIWDEMRTICDKRNEYEAIDLLGAFQAFLLYMLVLFFRLGQTPDNQLRQAMMDLQALATLAAKKGLTCIADNDHSSPLWEEWIVTEAKRRTLYVMYLFDSVLSSQENLPTFLGTELQGLPAPAGKYLWQAGTRAEWKHLYNVHLVEWPERLTIDELWPIPADMDAAEEMERRKRVNHWLEDVDEYGAMLYAVTSITHGV